MRASLPRAPPTSSSQSPLLPAEEAQEASAAALMLPLRPPAPPRWSRSRSPVDVLPLIANALTVNNPQVQLKALKAIPPLVDTIDYASLKNTIYPRLEVAATVMGHGGVRMTNDGATDADQVAHRAGRVLLGLASSRPWSPCPRLHRFGMHISAGRRAERAGPQRAVLTDQLRALGDGWRWRYRVQALICVHALLRVLDRTIIVQRVVPALKECKRPEPAVLVTTTSDAERGCDCRRSLLTAASARLCTPSGDTDGHPGCDRRSWPKVCGRRHPCAGTHSGPVAARYAAHA